MNLLKIVAVLLFLPLLMWQGTPAAKPIAPPNFVIIFADDLGYGDLGCFGSPTLQTPRLDRMAEEGMRFTNFYVAASVCTPSRAALVTGSYPFRVNLPKVLFPEFHACGQENGMAKGIHADEITVAELLKSRGYATGIVGKWHLGNQPEYLPTRHGFDEFFGFPYSNDMHPINGRRPYPPLPLIRNETVIETDPDQDVITQRYTEESISFIDRHREEPFFLYLAHAMPHRPLHARPRSAERHRERLAAVDESVYDGRDFLFDSVVEELDWSVGEILDALTDRGLAENTLVIFTSDNGPAVGSAGPLRGRKGSLFEGGLREPCIMWQPGTVPAGSECNEMALSMDILPTFAGLSGAAVPDDRVIDGKDILPLIIGTPGAVTPYEKFFYMSANRGLGAVRSGRWKLLLEELQKVPQGTLFDLDAEINEQTDVAADHPEVVRRLTKLAAAFREDLRQNSRPAGLSPVLP